MQERWIRVDREHTTMLLTETFLCWLNLGHASFIAAALQMKAFISFLKQVIYVPTTVSNYPYTITS